MRRKIEEAYSTSAQFEYAEQGFDRNWGPAAITNLMIALGAERRLDMPVDRTGLERGSAEDFYPIRVADEKVYMAVAMLGERELMYINADIFGRGYFRALRRNGALPRAGLYPRLPPRLPDRGRVSPAGGSSHGGKCARGAWPRESSLYYVAPSSALRK